MRTHCFISTTSANTQGARWAWHTADDNGVSRRQSETEFDDFHACVDDARAHGYHHVEVPVLHWSCAEGVPTIAAGPRDIEDVDEAEDGTLPALDQAQ